MFSQAIKIWEKYLSQNKIKFERKYGEIMKYDIRLMFPDNENCSDMTVEFKDRMVILKVLVTVPLYPREKDVEVFEYIIRCNQILGNNNQLMLNIRKHEFVYRVLIPIYEVESMVHNIKFEAKKAAFMAKILATEIRDILVKENHVYHAFEYTGDQINFIESDYYKKEVKREFNFATT
jgi:hypothetical protein